MGYLLKEALKILCGVNQWSYAVFWKIGYKNPKLLIWEECYYEPLPCSALPHISGIESSELPFEEWEECWVSPQTRTSQLKGQARDRVHSLVNRMMSNQVNVLGEGMVGRAAFTGNYQWILSENYIRDAHTPEVLNEVRHQYSAGMQTVAVIPVLPHGVVQLGSSLAILEDMGFVNDVKTLILQLACVPGALLSDNYATSESALKIGMPITLGTSDSANPSGNFKMTNSTSVIFDSYNQQSNFSRASRLIGEPSDSLERQNQEISQTSTLTFQKPNLYQSLVKPHHDHCQPEVIPVIKPNLPFRSQLENGVTGAIVIPPNMEAWLKQQGSSYKPGSGSNLQPDVGQPGASYSSLRLIEQQILSDSDLRDHVNDNQSASNSFIKSQLRTNGGLIHKNNKGSVSNPLLEGSGLKNGMTGNLRSISVPCSLSGSHRSADFNLPSMHLGGVGLQKADSSKTEAVPLSNLSGHLSTSHILSGLL
ncbi:hypothetical protein L1049_013436 [Liquidambar formosana]|uniref:Transcription factor MYC/MYB N-terminal domain-containing protein n=1 Tax=Liquidambar formosana TaxID=63359 RepID=A0AAP0RNH3_LIQFO